MEQGDAGAAAVHGAVATVTQPGEGLCWHNLLGINSSGLCCY